MQKVLESAITDIGTAFRMRRVWIALAAEDVSDQHRRTLLGPLWLLLNYLAFAGTFIYVFGAGDSIPHYPAYVATGLLVWLFMSEIVTQSISLFVREESMIKGTTLPLTTYVLRSTMQSVIRAGYAIVGCIVLLIASGDLPSINWLLSLPGLALIIVTTPAAIAVAGFAGAYFPDLQFIVANLMRLGMFLTPVFWVHNNDNGLRGLLYYYNPFTYFLEIFRVPIISGDFPFGAFGVSLLISIALWAAAVFLIGKYRKQVVFVL